MSEGRILEVLVELGNEEFKEFKQFLQQPVMEDLQPIPNIHLENAGVIQTFGYIMQSHPRDAEQTVLNLLKRMNKDSLAAWFQTYAMEPLENRIWDFVMGMEEEEDFEEFKTHLGNHPEFAFEFDEFQMYFDRTDVVKLLQWINHPFDAEQVMLQVLEQMDISDLLHSFQDSAMEPLKNRIRELVMELGEEEYEEFTTHLGNHPGFVFNFDACQSDNRQDVVNLLRRNDHPSDAEQIILQCMVQMTNSDLLRGFQGSSEESFWELGMRILGELKVKEFEDFIEQYPDDLKNRAEIINWMIRPVSYDDPWCGIDWIDSQRLLVTFLKEVYIDLKMHPDTLSGPSGSNEKKARKRMSREQAAKTVRRCVDSLNKETLIEALKEILLRILGELKVEEFEQFQRHMENGGGIADFNLFQVGDIEDYNRYDTVSLIMTDHPGVAEQILLNYLEVIDKLNMLETLLDTLKETREKKKRKRMSSKQVEPKDKKRKGKQDEPKDDPSASMSPKPREWKKVSRRWRSQLQKLANIEDSKVTKVKNLVFVKDDAKFRIAKGSDGTEVYLGLKDDGTEVAVKRMTKLNFHVLKNEMDLLRLSKLDHPSIVRYVDFAEDENFGYLALQLCECSLEKYIAEHSHSEVVKRKLANQFLKSLRILHCQNPQIVHRDIKPQNVLIDIQGKARLADFGISRELPEDLTTVQTQGAGTTCWKAKEILDKTIDVQCRPLGSSPLPMPKISYKTSADIQVAGMLIYYILSRGHHPFGIPCRCEGNILDGNYDLDQIQDVVAKDLIEWMINVDPKERPNVEKCLAHAFFRAKSWKVEYLRRVGNLEEVENCRKADKDEGKAQTDEDKNLIRSLKVLIKDLDDYAVQGHFNAWKQKFLEAKEKETKELFEKMDGFKMKLGQKKYPENSFGLLRFIRILREHYPKEAARIDLMEMFPGLFGYVHKFAKEHGWNSRPLLMELYDIK